MNNLLEQAILGNTMVRSFAGLTGTAEVQGMGNSQD
jgi:hypothetical protein